MSDHAPTKTFVCVSKRGCTDPEHVEGRRRYLRRTKKLLELGRRRYVPAGPAIAHIEALRAAGMNTTTIGEAAGLNPTHVAKVAKGHRATVNVNTERAILAVRAPGKHRVTSLGIIRRIHALACLGWSREALEAEIGMRLPTDQGQNGNNPPRNKAQADAVIAAYERLWRTPGRSRITAAYAARMRWAPPMAWDDIDDPRQSPQGIRRDSQVRRTPEQLVADSQELLDQGYPLDVVAARLEVTPGAIYAARSRAARRAS